MHLLSCEHPIRVYNKYLQEHVWCPCGKCNACKQRKAMKWTLRLERERSNSRYAFFVTLTYSEINLPRYSFFTFESYGRWTADMLERNDVVLESTRSRDGECIPFKELLFDEDSDKDLCMDMLNHDGIPYASVSDIQLFHKRLNKWFYQNVTNKYKNFRFFIVSELGSTTLRPHWHAIYFVNDSKVAERFAEGVLSSWRLGISDTQFVEGTACSYVAQYINKYEDYPSFYKASVLRPKFIFSKNPTIGTQDFSNTDGTLYDLSETDKEIFDKCLVQKMDYRRNDFGRVDVSTLDQSTENRLFPKCPLFRKISCSLRVELYSTILRFPATTFREFERKVRLFLKDLYEDTKKIGTLYTDILYSQTDGFTKKGIEWLRRLYYLSCRIVRQSNKFGCTVRHYVAKIQEYWNKKEIYLLSKFYAFQSEYVLQKGNSSEDLLFMYPEYVRDCGLTIGDLCLQYEPRDITSVRKDSANFAYSYKSTHFKNEYLNSLKDKNNYLFNSLINFYHAKKRHEIIEALAT